jgi:hypothetical protein
MNKSVKAAAKKQPKKTYSKPKLTTHGDVAKLTQHGHDHDHGHGRPGAGSGLFDMGHGDHGHD